MVGVELRREGGAVTLIVQAKEDADASPIDSAPEDAALSGATPSAAPYGQVHFVNAPPLQLDATAPPALAVDGDARIVTWRFSLDRAGLEALLEGGIVGLEIPLSTGGGAYRWMASYKVRSGLPKAAACVLLTSAGGL